MASDPSPLRPRKMVGWYDPAQLISTGVQVIISQILGSRLDYRLIESFGGEQKIFDFSHSQTCWFDYVADLGDGWDATYAIASLLGADHLRVSGVDSELPRGHFLIMGGDQVYPTASRDSYEERTVAPYSAAFPRSCGPELPGAPDAPSLFAIPGNHDWYDGLISFMRLFARTGWIGGWRTQQKRSYFAIKMPHNWWLWALDYQLESDIDQPQLDYFKAVADRMSPGANVILISAEPDWIYGHIYHPRYKKNIEYLQTTIIEERAEAKLRVAIAGDLHHYRRHEASDGSKVQLITSGGGGAFLLGTTGPKVDELEFGREKTKFRLQAAYPDRRTSSRLLLRNLFFPLINPKFGVLTGLLYLIIAWVYRVPVLREYEALLERHDPVDNAIVILRTILGSPFGFGILALVVVGFIAFTDTHARIYKYLAGTAHASANLVALFVVSAASAKYVREDLQLASDSVRFLLVSAALIFAGGYVAGSMIMGVYLYLSQSVFRRHSQEAFSSLRIRDYKHFLRMHVDGSGALLIHPIGIDTVPVTWRLTGDRSCGAVAPDNLKPHLIEPIIRIE